MNEDLDLQGLWQGGQSWEARIRPQLVRDIKAELGSLYASIKTRNRNELLAGALVVPVFLLLGYFMENPLARWGSWFVSAYGLWVMGVMAWMSRQRPQQELGLSFRQQLLQEIAYLQKEKLLLGRVVWWYLLPCLFGLGLFHWGLSSHWISFAVVMVFTLLILGYIYRLNQQAVNNKITPLLERLQALQKELDS